MNKFRVALKTSHKLNNPYLKPPKLALHSKNGTGFGVINIDHPVFEIEDINNKTLSLHQIYILNYKKHSET